VSYFLVPFALNFRQGYKSIISVSDKKEKSVSLTLSQVHFSQTQVSLDYFGDNNVVSSVQRVINADLGVQETKCYAIDVLHA